mmetsp:Transcript_12971/g.15117  ORF Transcript_12971/g.15117 Transcript_12971/m.15117 type:complete len:473 (-) Transcript_12971:99-1517(-)
MDRMKFDRLLQEDNETDSCVSPTINSISDGFQTFSLIWTIFVLILLATSCLWWYLRKDDLYLKRRNGELLPMVVVAAICSLLSGPVQRAASDSENVFNECWVQTFSFTLVVPSCVAFQVIRLLLFRNRVRYNRKVAELFTNNKQMTFASGTSKAESSSMTDSYETILRPLKSKATSGYAARLGSLLFAALVLYCCVFVVVNCRTFIFPNNECVFSTTASISVVFALLPIAAMGILHFLIARQTRNEPDPFGLLSEIRYSYAVPFVLGLISFGLGALDVGGQNEADVQKFSWAIIIDGAVVWYCCATITYRVFKTYTEATEDINLNVTLRDVLDNPTGSKLFEQHLINEFATENLTFWRAIENWKTSFDETSEETRKRMAKNIYNRWIKPGCILRINVSSDQEEEVRAKIFDRVLLERTTFDETQSEVYQLMASDNFLRFKSDPVFEEYYGLREPEMVAISGGDTSGIRDSDL